jgi:nicotinamidase-related amidase
MTSLVTIDPERSVLLVVDFQSRLMPAIHEVEIAVRNASRLIGAAKLCGIPRLFTEQKLRQMESRCEAPV